MTTTPKVFIFGGGKGMGLWIATHLFRDHSEVTVLDIDGRALSRLPSGISSIHLDPTPNYESIAASLPEGVWIVLATPMQALEPIGRQLLPHLRSGLVIQLASVQVLGEQAVRPYVTAQCTYLGMHPLFGPAITTPVGQIITLTECRQDDDTHRRFREFLHRRGVITTIATAEEHDEAMLYVQVLTHFTLLSFAQALGSQQKTFSSFARFRTPPFQFLSAFAGRLLKSAPTTIMGIQAVERAERIREQLLASAVALHDAIKSHRADPSALTALFEQIRSPYTGEEIDEAVTVSSVAADSIQHFDMLLHKFRSSRRAFFTRHRDSQRLIVGVLEDIHADEILLRPSLVAVPTSDGTRYAVAFNPTAAQNYRKLGIAFPTGKPIVLKKRKLSILPEEEIQRWISANALYLTHQRGFSNPREYDYAAIEHMVPRFLPDVGECTYIEGYKKKGKPENVTLLLTIAPWASITEVCSGVQSLLDGT